MSVITCESLKSYSDDIERQFHVMANEKDASEAAKDQVMRLLDRALALQDADLCLSLVPYIESDEGMLAHKYSGEVQRIYNILHIMELEKKAGKKLFFQGCHDKKALLEKYMLTLFALRRLAIALSDTSVNDAVNYLRQTEQSVFAIHLIIQNDLILPEITLYEKIIAVYSGIWNNHEVQQLLYLVAHCLSNKG